MTDDKSIALVTGANRGLGLETSRQLGKRGVKVLIGSRDLAKGEQAAESLRNDGIDAEAIQLDVSDSASISAAIAAISKGYRRLDILVNNAAVLNDIGLQPSEVSEDILRQNLDVNFIGPYLLTAGLTELLKAAPAGRVLNMGTQVGSFGNLSDPDSPIKDDICPAYQSSKIAFNSITALFSKEFESTNVKINSVCPGWVMTDMGHEDLPDYGDAVKPLTPSEAVEKILFLLDSGADVPSGGFFSNGEPVPW
ncbi:MAG: SDR family NAD(P)-dependent oxidoreductase [Desulfobulbaceae bacterium]|jgi:NAD(P)-dependent dehydrogenase (short-subunit alcohol dehydrogenase family)|nr:SDR family NAD(P)-dependent oxidoreductase [Desulfobulbaceae bacterium]